VSVSMAAQTNLPLVDFGLGLVHRHYPPLLPRDPRDDALQGVHPPIDRGVARPYDPVWYVIAR